MTKSTTFTCRRVPGGFSLATRETAHPEGGFFRKERVLDGRVCRRVCSTVLFLILLTMQTRRALIVTAFFLSLFCCSTVFAHETTKQIRERIVRERKPAVVYLFTPS